MCGYMIVNESGYPMRVNESDHHITGGHDADLITVGIADVELEFVSLTYSHLHRPPLTKKITHK